ncbi:MAG: TonB-dependent receptor [Chitinophagales bacterium]
MKKIYAFVVLTLLYSTTIFAQTGELQGKVFDQVTKEGIPFANIVLELNGSQKAFGETDDNGRYTIKPVNPGTYDIKVSYLGYRPKVFTGVIVNSDKITFQDIPMESSVETLPDIVVSTQKLVEPDKTTTGSTITKDEIANIATRDTRNYASLTAGVFQRDDEDALNIGGARDYSTKYYIDGIAVRSGGSVNLPASAIEQLTVLTGGIPARYGDATGGIINITTRGPSQSYSGGVEVVTSELLDGYGYNLLNFNLSGPLFTKNKGTDSSNTKIGFFITGEYEHNKDSDPSAVGMYKVKDDVLADLQANPLTPSPTASGFVPSSSFLTSDDIESIKYKQNVADNNYRFSGKLDFQLSKLVTLTVGGDFNLSDYYSFTYTRSLVNAQEGNTFIKDNTYRGYVRFTQRFASGGYGENKSASIFQNAYYSIQADYSKFTRKYEDKTLGFDAFSYGYVGKFETLRQPIYTLGTDSVSGLYGSLLAGYEDTLVNFTPGTQQPLLSNYTSQYYDLVGDNPDGNYNSLTDILNGGGLLNGILPTSTLTIYSMFLNTGYPIGGYGTRDQDQLRLSLNASVDIVNVKKGDNGRHALEFGFEYEQRVDRNYSVSPLGLWGLARQLTNQHIATLDTKNPLPVYDDFGVFLDTVNYNRLFVGDDQSFFDKSLREALGLDVSGLDYIDIDALDPSQLNLGMFSPDELLNNGNYLVYTTGYDYLGNKLTSNPSVDDFFNQKDENGNYARLSPAFRPIYSSAYLQDKFNFRDLIFNVGIRVDRFDANQQVLKDKYSLYPIRSAAEVTEFGNHPASIGDDYAVYVNDLANPSQIVGYRDGDTWYNADGTQINDPGVIAKASTTGGITPYLVSTDVDNLVLTSESFEDYTPQFTVMPRIAFSFPISDEALFFAHYDVLSQRPQGATAQTPSGNALIANAFQYYYLSQLNTDNVMANPALKPERTIDYQVGFKQALGAISAITISGTYRELKDMIQVQKVGFAYPVEYRTFGNTDFGTVKSLQVTYELRRIKNVKLDANYTLQFADGTGSDITSGLNLVGSGQPNLRSLIPFSYDQRHAFTASVDYRYGEGRSYNGPVVGKNSTALLANTGLNFIFRAGSGTPYTRQSTPTPDAVFGVQTSSSITGSVNGSRLPWSIKLDAKIDKDFKIGNDDKTYYFNVYLLVQNLLNTANIVSVYSYTGNPDDDGYIDSATGQQALQTQLDPESYEYLYGLKINNPNNYSQPRRIHLGLQFNF